MQRLFCGVVESMLIDQIKVICEVYSERKFHQGLIQLCLLFASKKDPANYGLKFYLSDKSIPQVTNTLLHPTQLTLEGCESRILPASWKLLSDCI